MKSIELELIYKSVKYTKLRNEVLDMLNHPDYGAEARAVLKEHIETLSDHDQSVLYKALGFTNPFHHETS